MIRERFPQLASKNSSGDRQETIFQFAPEDAMQVHINDGRSGANDRVHEH